MIRRITSREDVNHSLLVANCRDDVQSESLGPNEGSSLQNFHRLSSGSLRFGSDLIRLRRRAESLQNRLYHLREHSGSAYKSAVERERTSWNQYTLSTVSPC